MAIFTAQAARLLARELYDYELDDAAANALANGAGATMTLLRQLPAPPEHVQPPFGYAALVAEAQTLAGKSRG